MNIVSELQREFPQASLAKWGGTGGTDSHIAQVIERMTLQTADALARSVFAADPYTGRHVRGVAVLGERIASNLGLGEKVRRTVYLGGLLHDVGKLSISGEILNAPRKLDAQEIAIVRTHPEVGAQIVYGLDLDQPVQDAVLHHHERWDGEGYPARLTADSIPLSARIVAVADTMHALLKGRPYRGGKANADIAQILERGAGSQWDERVIAAAVPLLAQAA